MLVMPFLAYLRKGRPVLQEARFDMVGAVLRHHSGTARCTQASSSVLHTEGKIFAQGTL